MPGGRGFQTQPQHVEDALLVPRQLLAQKREVDLVIATCTRQRSLSIMAAPTSAYSCASSSPVHVIHQLTRVVPRFLNTSSPSLPTPLITVVLLGVAVFLQPS